MSKNLLPLIQHAKDKHNITAIGITSNGIVLKDKLHKLQQAGLSSVNISLDTLEAAKFAAITRRGEKNMYRVLSSIYAAAAQEGLTVKVRVLSISIHIHIYIFAFCLWFISLSLFLSLKH